MESDLLSVYSLNWGMPYLDYYNVNARNATIILNVSFSQNDLSEIFQYTLSLVLWALQEVPKGTLITVIFDIRGQTDYKFNMKIFEKELKESLNKLIGKNRFFIVFKS